MDIFELAYKIVGQGQTEANDALKQTDAAGQKAAATLTEVEAAAQRASVAGQKVAAAFQEAGLQFDQGAFNKGVAQGIAQEMRNIQGAATATVPGLGTFNQALGATERSALNSTRGLYMLDRGLGAMVGSALGASSGFERLGEGLLLFSTAGHEATLILAAIAAVALPVGYAYNTLFERTNALKEASDRLYDGLAKDALTLTGLAAATEGLAIAMDKQAEAQKKLDRLRAEEAQGGQVGQLAAARAKAFQDRADVAAGATMTAEMRRTQELVAAKAKELQQLAESIRLGTIDAAGRQRIVELVKDATQIEQTANLTREQRNQLEKAAQGITDAYAGIQRKATEAERKRLQAIRDQQEALIRQASLAEQTLSVLGQTPERIGALRVALAALTAATSEDNLTRLVNLGLIQQAVQLLDAQKKATQALADATKEAIPGRAAPSFGLGGVTTGAQGGPLTFGPGISLAPAQEAALLPERSLTLPFGQGTLPPLIPGDFFSQAVKTLGDGFAKVRQKTALEVRTTMADTVPRFIDFGNVLRATLTGALQGIGDALGELIAGLITGATSAIGGFGRAILATLGDAIASFGKALIALGIQIEAAKAFALALGGFGLIGVGLALVAIGGAIGGVARAAQTAFGGTGGAGGTSPSTTPIRVVVVDTSLGAAGRVRQPAPFIYAPTNIGVTDPGGQRALAKMGQFAQRRNITGVNRIGT